MIAVGIVITLLLSALFSGAEIAYVSANKLRIELKKKRGGGRGRILASFYDNPASFLGTMLVGNNIVLVVFTILMNQVLEPFTSAWIENEFLLLLTNTIVTTIVVLIFGEFLPKTLFRTFPDEILYFLAYPIQLFKLILIVPAWLMSKTANGLLSLFSSASVENAAFTFTRLDLEKLVNDAPPEAEENIDRAMFGRALNLKDTRVRSCMIPRPEVEYIDVNESMEALKDLFIETSLSRVLVIDGEVDNVLGYIHHQQLFQSPKAIRDAIMEIPFVPEVMRVTDLLNLFIVNRKNIACIVDEYGGLAGIITLEDILEEITGEIEDEHDSEEYTEETISSREYVFSGRLEVTYLNEKYPMLHLPEGEYHTLSGYLVTTTESIPEQGAELTLENNRYILEQVSETKIEKVRVFIESKEEKEGEG